MLKNYAAVVAMLTIANVEPVRADVAFLNSGKGGLPFSEAVRHDRTLYLAGQVGLDSATGKLVTGGIEAESHQTMKNIKSIVESNGYSMNDLAKCTVFLADMKEWPAFNAVYRDYFNKDRYPSRSAIGVNGIALNARVEVECTAVK